MYIRVLKANIYNGPGNRSLGFCAVGTIIEVDDPYGCVLINDGLGIDVQEPQPVATEPDSEPATIEPVVQKNRGGRPKKVVAGG